MSSCIILRGDLLKPWSYYLVEEQWTFSTVFNKIMRGELSSSESEAYAVDIDQTEHRLVKVKGELSSSESEAYAVDIDQTEHRLVKVCALSL